jgi:3-hydroxyacyl-CoA dehydrogenase
VLLLDSSSVALKSAIEYISDALTSYCADRGTHPGHVSTTTDLISASNSNPWMVIEALPENLELKRTILNEVERLAPHDCILATNSSSFRSQEMAGAVGVTQPERLLNTHYYIPPRNKFVELMSSGSTDDKIIPFVVAQMERCGLRPIVLPNHIQSNGFIFNRIWAAMKRESLAVLAEGASKPMDIDELFRDFFHAEKGPCEKMDEVWLDRVRNIEAHYLGEQPELGSGRQLDWLSREYVEKGLLGEKTGDGLFTAGERAELAERRRREKRKIVEESKGA